MSVSRPKADTMGTRRDPDVSRYKVDVSNTAFWEGREYRVSLEFEVDGSEVVVRFESPVDFILQRQQVSADGAGARLRTYRAAQGSESGTFTPAPVYKVNFMSEAPDVANQATVSTGGAFTPDPGEESVETVRVVSSSSTAQAQTVSGAVGDERGLPAGIYYLVFDKVTGSGAATVVYGLKWEERAA